MGLYMLNWYLLKGCPANGSYQNQTFHLKGWTVSSLCEINRLTTFAILYILIIENFHVQAAAGSWTVQQAVHFLLYKAHGEAWPTINQQGKIWNCGNKIKATGYKKKKKKPA